MWLKLPLIGSKLATRPLLTNVWVSITWSFFIRFDVRPHQNDPLIETNPIVKYHSVQMLVFELLFVTFGVQTQKYPQVVGTCPAYHHKLITQNKCSRKIGHHKVKEGIHPEFFNETCFWYSSCLLVNCYLEIMFYTKIRVPPPPPPPANIYHAYNSMEI